MRVSWPQRNRAFGFLDALGLTGLTGLLVARFVPVARLPFWRCEWRRLTGWPCPGCGLTRAADHFAHGDLAGAWQANPLGTVAAAAFALAVLASFAHLAFALPPPRVELSPREARLARVALGAAVLANYAYVVLATRFPGLL
jgi:hypothetical protein